jgi:hypothetical protein
MNTNRSEDPWASDCGTPFVVTRGDLIPNFGPQTHINTVVETVGTVHSTPIKPNEAV